MSLEAILELYVAVLLTSWCIFDVCTYFKSKKKPRNKKSANIYPLSNRKRSGE